MRLHSSPSASTHCRTLPTIFPPVAQKRCRQPSPSPLPTSPTLAEPDSEASLPPTTGASSFRNVSACHRCRRRKNKCDKRLPACLTCERAGEKCVGHDPILQRDIPRSYVHYLEKRNEYLESLLTSNQIPFLPPDDFDVLAPSLVVNTSSITTPPPNAKYPSTPASTIEEQSPLTTYKEQRSPEDIGQSVESPTENQGRLHQLVSDIGLVPVQGLSDPRYLGPLCGASFSRVAFAAIKSSSSVGGGSHCKSNGSHRAGVSYGDAETADVYSSDSRKEYTGMRESFFGLATSRERVQPAKWPSRQLANYLIGLYFGNANPQLPILHKGEFEDMVDQVYSTLRAERIRQEKGGSRPTLVKKVGARELYMMNIVFAIGAGIFLEKSSGFRSSSGSGGDDIKRKKTRNRESVPGDNGHEPVKGNIIDSDDPICSPEEPRLNGTGGDDIRQGSANTLDSGDDGDGVVDPQTNQETPEAYHAAALPYLEAFLSSETKSGVEELQALLLLAGYALIRPVPPGLWYIVGVAVRLAIDLGLHFEDSSAGAVGGTLDTHVDNERLRGQREWVMDLRRRLWWCTYSMDRLVSICVGRPLGIQDEVVSTRFPSLLPDEYIKPDGFKTPAEPCSEGSTAPVLPTYKLISHHYFRLRLLQSEILQVLQQQQQSMSTSPYPSYHPFHLRTPYLREFPNLQEWHTDVNRRLEEWIKTAPNSKEETGADFSPEFFELNYWQTVLMLYRPCLQVPASLSGELGGGRGMIDSRGKGVGIGQLRGGNMDMGGLTPGTKDEEEKICWTVAQAGREVLMLYRRLHRVHRVNYTFLATHHLFMSGITFLYAIWHSPSVRSKISMDEIDHTIWAASSVLGDLVKKCPPAQACKEAFDRMSKATVERCSASNHRTMSIQRSLEDTRMARKRRIIGERGVLLAVDAAGSGSHSRVPDRVFRGNGSSGSGNGSRSHDQILHQQQQPNDSIHVHQQQQQQQQQQQHSCTSPGQGWHQTPHQAPRTPPHLQQQRSTTHPIRDQEIFDMENLVQYGPKVHISESSDRTTQQLATHSSNNNNSPGMGTPDWGEDESRGGTIAPDWGGGFGGLGDGGGGDGGDSGSPIVGMGMDVDTMGMGMGMGGMGMGGMGMGGIGMGGIGMGEMEMGLDFFGFGFYGSRLRTG